MAGTGVGSLRPGGGLLAVGLITRSRTLIHVPIEIDFSGAISFTISRKKFRRLTRFAAAMKWLCIVACCLVGMGRYELSAADVPPGFAETDIPGPVNGEWNGAVGVTFDATGRMFVWEREGRVWFKDPSDPSFSLLLDISEEVGAW